MPISQASLQNSISATHFAFIRRCERPRLRPARAGELREAEYLIDGERDDAT